MKAPVILTDMEQMEGKKLEYFDEHDLFITDRNEILILQCEDFWVHGESDGSVLSSIRCNKKLRDLLLEKGVVDQEYINNILNDNQAKKIREKQDDYEQYKLLKEKWNFE